MPSSIVPGLAGGTGFATFSLSTNLTSLPPKSTKKSIWSFSSSATTGISNFALSVHTTLLSSGIDNSSSPLPNVKTSASSGTTTTISPFLFIEKHSSMSLKKLLLQGNFNIKKSWWLSFKPIDCLISASPTVTFRICPCVWHTSEVTFLISLLKVILTCCPTDSVWSHIITYEVDFFFLFPFVNETIEVNNPSYGSSMSKSSRFAVAVFLSILSRNSWKSMFFQVYALATTFLDSFSSRNLCNSLNLSVSSSSFMMSLIFLYISWFFSTRVSISTSEGLNVPSYTALSLKKSKSL